MPASIRFGEHAKPRSIRNAGDRMACSRVVDDIFDEKYFALSSLAWEMYLMKQETLI